MRKVCDLWNAPTKLDRYRIYSSSEFRLNKYNRFRFLFGLFSLLTIFWSCNKGESLSVSTVPVTIITDNSARSGGEIISDRSNSVTARGVCWNTSNKPTINDSKTNDGSGIGSFESNLTDLKPNTQYYVRSYATNDESTIYGNQETFTTQEEITVKDVEGNVYHGVYIGHQVWMKENLKTTKYNNGLAINYILSTVDWSHSIVGGYCWYDSNEAKYKNTYGALYNWWAVSNPSGLCPIGWHVPTNNDWMKLHDFLIVLGYNYDGTTTDNKIAKSLAATTNWVLNSDKGTVGNTDYPSYRNKTGFSALPGGLRYENGNFSNVGIEAVWWSSSGSADYGGAYILYLSYNSDALKGGGPYYVNMGCSVRCIKD
jgi:uncharacterized protein (TIGR02145 family)